MTDRFVPREITAIDYMEILGPPPIVEGEDLKEYRKLYELLWRETRPANMREKIVTREAIDDTWVANRSRRLVDKIAPNLFETANGIDRTAYYTMDELRTCPAAIQEHALHARRSRDADESVGRVVRRRNAGWRELDRQRVFEKRLQTEQAKKQTR
jgi:hypothetical protein